MGHGSGCVLRVFYMRAAPPAVAAPKGNRLVEPLRVSIYHFGELHFVYLDRGGESGEPAAESDAIRGRCE